MKKNIISLSICLYFALFACETVYAQVADIYEFISYKITPNFNKKILYVNAKYYGNFKHSEIIDMPYKWGNKNYLSLIKNITISDVRSQISFNKENNYELNIQLPKQTNLIEINYEVHLEDKNIPFDLKSFIMLPNLIHIPGHALFALPSNLKPENNLKISVSWNDIPTNFEIESSYGSGVQQNFNSNNFDLLHSIFIIGNFRKYEVSIRDNILRLCIYGNFDFNDPEIIQSTKKIIQSQRDFFKDYSFKNYLVTVIEPNNINSKIASMGGIALHNSFAAYFSQGITKTQFKKLLAHEHLHNWIGGAIKNTEEELNYWWSEGFTDYYALVLTARYNSLPMDEFLREINDVLEEYYNSEFLNASNATIKNGFWNDYNLYRQVYLRGFVFALYLNCKIKSYAQSLSIDEVLKYFYINHKNIKFSNRNFIIALQSTNTYTKEIEKYFNDTIIKGETISLKDCNFCLPIDRLENYRKNNFYYKMKTKLSKKEKNQVIKFFNFYE